MFDRGVITDLGSDREVWALTGAAARPAGGAGKNLLFDGEITLPAGRYLRDLRHRRQPCLRRLERHAAARRPELRADGPAPALIRPQAPPKRKAPPGREGPSPCGPAGSALGSGRRSYLNIAFTSPQLESSLATGASMVTVATLQASAP